MGMFDSVSAFKDQVKDFTGSKENTLGTLAALYGGYGGVTGDWTLANAGDNISGMASRAFSGGADATKVKDVKDVTKGTSSLADYLKGAGSIGGAYATYQAGKDQAAAQEAATQANKELGLAQLAQTDRINALKEEERQRQIRMELEDRAKREQVSDALDEAYSSAFANYRNR